MKKRKLFEVSLINKAYSRVIQNTTRFYTSDTALEIGFDIVELEYSFDSAVIILLNENDRSLVTRELTSSGKGFTYELESDIIEHYGNWAAQLKLEKDGEVYISSPVGFSIENDLYNSRPPKLSEVNTWKNLRSTADGLIDDIQSELESFEEKVSEIESAELLRIENENQRNLTSVEEFVKLQNAIGGRNYLLNSGEPSSLNFISNNSSISPLIRGVEDGVDWIYQNNLNTNEFALSTFVGGMQYPTDWSGYTGDITISVDVMSTHPVTLRLGFSNTAKDTLTPNEWRRFTFTSKSTSGLYAEPFDNESVPHKTKVYWKNYKIEKGTQVTPYTKAPEDYTIVSKEDYYNHVKMMNDIKMKSILEKANKKQEGWITPTLVNGWVNVDEAQPLRFMKDEFGFVHIQGRIRNGGLRAHAFTLPVGYGSSRNVYGIFPNGGSSNTFTKGIVDTYRRLVLYNDNNDVQVDISFKAGD